MRKTPKQDRAAETVETILDAAAQLLERSELREVSTNHIARKAGVSIGTLYQYFSNKDELLWSLAKREYIRIAKQLVQQIDEVSAESMPETSRAIVKLLIARFANRKITKRLGVLVQTRRAQRGGGEEPLLAAIAEALGNKLGLVGRMSLEQAKVFSFILTRSLLGTIRSAMSTDLEMMKSQEFEDQLVLLMTAYIDQA